MSNEGLTPSLPLFTPRFCGAFVSPFLEEGGEGVFRADGDDAAVVEPDSVEDELEKLTLGFRVFLIAPEDREVVEDLFRLVKVGERVGCTNSVVMRGAVLDVGWLEDG